MRIRRSIVVAGVMGLVACGDDAVAPVAPGVARQIRQETAYSARPDDPAMSMRTGLRARGEQEVVDAVLRGQLVVTVGFKPETAPWGVDERGRVLVPDDVKRQHMRAVERVAKRVIYRFAEIPAITVELPDAQAALGLRRMPWVDYVAEATQLLTPDAVLVECFDQLGNPPPRGTAVGPEEITWNISRVRADQAWSIATGALFQRDLLIMDDGADEQQAALPLGPELGNAVGYKRYVGQTVNDGYHGTPVLGAAAARRNSVGVVGVAPGARTRIAKIADRNSGTSWGDAGVARAIDEHSTLARVHSLSYSTKQTSSTPPFTFAPMYDAIKRAYYTHGVVIVASTGNQEQANLYAYPAAYPEVVGVGGSGYGDQFVLNNYAPGNVELAAPALGIGTVCKGGQTGYATGTSFATPMVAGAFMVLRERLPYDSPAQLRERLRVTALPMGDPQKSGAGRIDLLAALTHEAPLAIGISGPGSVSAPGTFTWFSNASGGVGTYTYRWYESFDGGVEFFDTGITTRDYTAYLDYGTDLRVVVTSGSQTRQDDHNVYYDGPCDPCYDLAGASPVVSAAP